MLTPATIIFSHEAIKSQDLLALATGMPQLEYSVMHLHVHVYIDINFNNNAS